MKPTIKHLVITLCGLVFSQLATAGPTFGETAASISSPEASPLALRLQAAHTELAKRNFARADALFKESAAIDPKSPQPALGLAESARLRNEADKAVSWLKKATEISPSDPQVLSAWARWHYGKKDYSKAEEFWQKAIAADANATAPLISLGDLYSGVHGQHDKAAVFYRRAIAIDPGLAGAHHALGMSALARKDPLGAIAEFEEAARLSPRNPLPLQALARAQVMNNKPEAALAALDRALKIMPEYFPLRLDKGDVYLAQGKADLARAEYMAAAKAQPKQVEPQLKLGMLYQQKEQRAEALAAYQTAITINPNAALAYNNMAWMVVERNEQLDKALEWANKAVSLAPDEPAFQDTLGWVLRKRGETDKAIALYQKLAAGSGQKIADIHYHLGLAYADKGRKKEAITSLRKALEIDPGFSGGADAKAQIAKLGPV